jgi:TorA maturation chaperone TorD
VREVRPALSPREAEAIVQRAYREVLDRAPDPQGLRDYRNRLLREGWTERRLIEELQRSAEARSINPDQAISRMYRDELGREPDPDGLNHYRQLWRDGWTQGRIREDLRRSPEGRQAATRLMIARLYRELLGREPDTAGLADYERLVRERGYTEREIRASIMRSPEYREKHPRGR